LCAYRYSACTALGQSLPVANPETVGLSSAKLENLNKALQAEVDKGHIPGAVIMINRRGNLAYSQAVGYQNKDADLPMRREAIFRIYSMTKPNAAVAAMLLAEDGKLVLADPVGKYLPEFANMQVCNASKDAIGKTVRTLVPAEKPIIVQDLLRHTSGIGYGETTTNSVIKQAYVEAGLYVEGGTDYNQRRVLPKDDVTGLARAPLSSQPGTNWKAACGRSPEKSGGLPPSTPRCWRQPATLQSLDVAGQISPIDRHLKLAELVSCQDFVYPVGMRRGAA
jgi:CubicO group peptidase (beta-lactamase class C family)